MQEILVQTAAIARLAGAEILRFYAGPIEPMRKKDGSVVTIADKTSESIILPKLLPLLPGVPCVSEESVEDGIIPDTSAGNFWCIDPLDGTRNFVEKNGHFAVNIGLVLNFQPVLGVVYVPVGDTLYAGGVGVDGWVEKAGGRKTLLPLRTPNDPLQILIERKKQDNERQKAYSAKIPGASLVYTEDPWRFCELAAGSADLCPYFSLSYEWDTAAPHAILRGVNGELVTEDKKPLSYGKRPNFKNPGVLAARVDLLPNLPDF